MRLFDLSIYRLYYLIRWSKCHILSIPLLVLTTNNNMKNKLLFLIAFATLFSIKSFAQPSNDLCSGAITLPVGASCSNTLVTFDGTATDSGLSNPGCADYLGGDLWYSLTMPASGIVTIVASNNDGSISNVGMAAYIGGDCNTLTKLSCAIDNGGTGFPEATISQPVGATI